MIKRFLFFYYSQDKYCFYAVTISLLCAFLLTLTFALLLPKLPSKLPLFYSLTWGEPQLANTVQYLILPLIIILVSMINLIISWHLHPSQIIIKRIANLSTMLVSFIILITGMRILTIFI